MQANQYTVFVISSSNKKRRGSISERLTPIFYSDNFNMILVSRRINDNLFWKSTSYLLELLLKVNNGLRIFLLSNYNSRKIDLFVFSYFAILYIKTKIKNQNSKYLIHLVEPSEYIIRFAKKKQIKLIYELNTSIESYFENLKSNGTIYSILRGNKSLYRHQKYCVQNAEKVIVPSCFVHEQISGYREEGVSVIPYYITNWKAQKEINGNDIIRIGFVGNWTLNKGSQMYLDLATNLKTNGKFEFNAFGRVYSNSIDLSNINHLGFLSREEIYNSIDVLFLASWGEGSARVGYEAVSHGVLFVGSLESGLPFKKGSPWLKKHDDLHGFLDYFNALNHTILNEHSTQQREQLIAYTTGRYVNSVYGVYNELIRE